MRNRVYSSIREIKFSVNVARVNQTGLCVSYEDKIFLSDIGFCYITKLSDFINKS